MIHSRISREISWFYPWLRRLSSRLIGSEYRGKTLQPTALANEIIVKLLRWKGELNDETERSLRVLATTIAKQTLIDHGRRRSHRESYVRNYRDANETRGHIYKTVLLSQFDYQHAGYGDTTAVRLIAPV